MKLNLGCGNRVFGEEGWINVDLFDAGPPGVAYVKADISKKLPFEDDSAEEVFSCHVIEHFWPWDVNEILRDWIRVLKPAGMLVIECPNLRGAAALLIEAEKIGHGDMWRAAMNAFYGDPKDTRIEDRHKWGYTQRTLIGLLKKLGLSDVHQEPAQYKMREPRDMRVVGIKG